MSFSITYKPLFTVNVLHQYYLDDGEQKYASMSDDDKRHRMGMYDLSGYAEIVPTTVTRLKLVGHGLVFKPVKTGFVVWCETDPDNEMLPKVSLEDDMTLTFLVKIKDRLFFNYTGLPMDTAGKLYLFSNSKPSSVTGSFPLIKEANSFVAIDKDYCLSDDVAKDELKELKSYELRGAFALISIRIKGETDDLSVTNTHGEIDGKGFEILLRNRKTFWRYIFPKDQIVNPADDLISENGSNLILVTKDAKPLTKDGFVVVSFGGKQLPNAHAVSVLYDDVNDKYYSEIYM